jgi:hypothetical protein
LELWVDTRIQAGDEWLPAILTAIERSQFAVLMVSADFLNSAFIMEHELPALVARRVRLAPVLVGDCLWASVPALAAVQWLHDPGRDGALNRVADQPGERDRRLRELCDRLVALVSPAAVPPVHEQSLPRAPDVVTAVAPSAPAGDLVGVPALPPAYIPREELPAMLGALLESRDPETGSAEAVRPMGLHGEGGTGKSTLAAALHMTVRSVVISPTGSTG